MGGRGTEGQESILSTVKHVMGRRPQTLVVNNVQRPVKGLMNVSKRTKEADRERGKKTDDFRVVGLCLSGLQLGDKPIINC